MKKISNTEWWLGFGALLTIDIVQMLLDGVALGLVVNPFIDMFVGMTYGLYLQLRGQSLGDPKRLVAWAASMLGVGISEGVLPLWCLDGLYNMYLAKAEEKLEQAAKATKVTKFIPRNRENNSQDQNDTGKAA